MLVIVSRFLPDVQLLKTPPPQCWASSVTGSAWNGGLWWESRLISWCTACLFSPCMFFPVLVSAGSCCRRFLLHKCYAVPFSSKITMKGSMIKFCVRTNRLIGTFRKRISYQCVRETWDKSRRALKQKRRSRNNTNPQANPTRLYGIGFWSTPPLLGYL